MTQSEGSEDARPASTWKYISIERYNMVMKTAGTESDRFKGELLPDRSAFRKKVDRLEPILAMEIRPEGEPVDTIDVP